MRVLGFSLVCKNMKRDKKYKFQKRATPGVSEVKKNTENKHKRVGGGISLDTPPRLESAP